MDHGALAALYRRHVAPLAADALSALMNGPIKAKLGIAANVTWGGQSDEVFSTLSGDFMRPVVDVLDRVLAAGKVNVTVYEGQADLICGTMGAERWMARLQWPGMANFYATEKSVFFAGADSVDPAGFSIVTNGLSLYYILLAGHMVPTDAPLVRGRAGAPARARPLAAAPLYPPRFASFARFPRRVRSPCSIPSWRSSREEGRGGVPLRAARRQQLQH